MKGWTRSSSQLRHVNPPMLPFSKRSASVEDGTQHLRRGPLRPPQSSSIIHPAPLPISGLASPQISKGALFPSEVGKRANVDLGFSSWEVIAGVVAELSVQADEGGLACAVSSSICLRLLPLERFGHLSAAP